MTGPPYPRPQPAPGSNGIGLFAIGVSQVGTIPPFDWWNTVISQYANSPILTQLIDNFFQYIDQTANLDAFFDMIWNVDTAQGYGLDVWGRIVDVSRTLHVPVTDEYLTFEEAGDPVTYPFDIFYSGQPTTSNFDLPDDDYRVLIFAKALANISDGSIPAINQLLLNLFPNQGNCYVVDGLDMTMTYTFATGLSPTQRSIVANSGALPKPAGVSASVFSP